MKGVLVLTTIFLLIGIARCREDVPPGEPTGFIQVKGPDTIVNTAQKVAEEFMKEYPHVFTNPKEKLTENCISSYFN